MTNQPASQEMVKGYDLQMYDEGTAYYYGYSDFYNYGYWEPGIHSQKEACENLVEKLLGFIPDRRGRILDVACGMGATTRHLLNYYNAADVVGVNISEAQLARARQNAPGATFLAMDATNLQFEDASFDNVICVEAAFHFNTRDNFLSEAHRILKPGGRLVMSDILFLPIHPRAAERMHIPLANRLDDPAAYQERFLAAGFQAAAVTDATEACWQGFYNHLGRWPKQERQAGRLTFRQYVRAALTTRLTRNFLKRGIRYYVLSWAQC